MQWLFIGMVFKVVLRGRGGRIFRNVTKLLGFNYHNNELKEFNETNEF